MGGCDDHDISEAEADDDASEAEDDILAVEADDNNAERVVGVFCSDDDDDSHRRRTLHRPVVYPV